MKLQSTIKERILTQVDFELELHLEAKPVAVTWVSRELLLVADANGLFTVLEKKVTGWTSYRLMPNLPACLPHSLAVVHQGRGLSSVIEMISLSLVQSAITLPQSAHMMYLSLAVQGVW